LVSTGCSLKLGNIGEKTHFSYPNSNIKPLGHVQASKSKRSFIIPPTLTADDVRGLMNDALSQKAGADLIINYKVDTQITVIPIPIFTIYTLELTLSGTAVSMEVGQQELEQFKQTLKQTQY
jgi:hypothetical protein